MGITRTLIMGIIRTRIIRRIRTRVMGIMKTRVIGLVVELVRIGCANVSFIVDPSGIVHGTNQAVN